MALAHDDDGLDREPYGTSIASWPVSLPSLAPVKPPRETRFGRISFGQLRDRKAKAPNYVIDDWMVAREQSMLAGESQSGKSFLGIHAALSIAAGMPIFGRRVSPGLVIYQAGESGTGVLDLRIPAWTQHFGAELPEHMPFEILPAKVDLWSEQGNAKAFIETVKAIAEEHKPVPLRAVFIDTLSKAMAGANENDGPRCVPGARQRRADLPRDRRSRLHRPPLPQRREDAPRARLAQGRRRHRRPGHDG